MKINDLLNIKSNYSNDEKKIILSFLLDLPKLDLFKLEILYEYTYKRLLNIIRFCILFILILNFLFQY